jgi:hypothetical protein
VDADAVLAQSIGGGGGHGSSATAVSPGGYSQSIGGSGGSGNDAGTVTYTDTGAAGRLIQTKGDRSRGVFLQSVGGSGGDAGNALSIISPSLSPVSIALGSSGSGGDGGAVAYKTGIANITTAGVHASAIQALSVGGGGGNAGTSISASGFTFADFNLTVGGSGAGGGSAGTASVQSNGALSTAGARARHSCPVYRWRRRQCRHRRVGQPRRRGDNCACDRGQRRTGRQCRRGHGERGRRDCHDRQ